MSSFVCSAPLYEYQGYLIELGLGDISPLKRSGDPYIRCPARAQQAILAFLNLPESERERYRVGGGCERLIDPAESKQDYSHG